MASEKILNAKKEKVAALVEKMQGAKSVILVDYKGISVSVDTKLRAEMREAGVQYMVEKNSILSHVFDKSGLDAIKGSLEGATAVAFSTEDAVAPARVLQKYSDLSKAVFNIKSGVVDGRAVDAAEIKSIALLPNRDTLIAMVCGALNGTIAALARALSEVAKQQEAA